MPRDVPEKVLALSNFWDVLKVDNGRRGIFHTAVRGTMVVGSGVVTPGLSRECDLLFLCLGTTKVCANNCVTVLWRRAGPQGAERHRTDIPGDT